MNEERHDALRSLLGAWSLGACPPREAAELEQHLRGCPECAEEAARLRDAAGWLSLDEPLDQPGSLRQQVLDWCLARRPAELPLPSWGMPYTAETAKLDALLRDLGQEEWQEVAELPWHGGAERLRPAEVLGRLTAGDGFLALALGLPDPAPAAAPSAPTSAPTSAWASTSTPPVGRRVPPQEAAVPAPRVPRVPSQGGRYAAVTARTARLLAYQAGLPPQSVRARWRQQTHDLVRSAALAPYGGTPVDLGFAVLPLRDAFVDRALECFVHGEDVARAVAYPYDPPAPQHLRQMVELVVRLLPRALGGLRAARPEFAAAPTAPGAPAVREARRLRLVVDGPAAGEWLVPLDGEEAGPPGGEPVASMVLDGLELCQLAAAHRDPDRLPVGEHGDRAAVREVLHALPLLSRP
ncbi:MULTISPECIES: zf-HC2 domain-containing protein [Kitasatospora]|uniref:Zf-HC2 domain-containing protein n=1 Tax=Kitasatospora cathayae TaxID=3004092 RepID=A0ABY7QHV4_9ACTN|nr:zf-HC2 domain-containing protein [Kitasatospora sp. HUAS 3-15]WBP91641.1 zf-HC2 domain-containing protein [Kitasatospora sp. HUAS 3-15]